MLRERNPMAEIMVTHNGTNVNELFVPSQSFCYSMKQLKDNDDHLCDHEHEHEHEHEHPHSRHRLFSIVLDEPLNQNYSMMC